MHQNDNTRHMIDILFVLSLFALFAISSVVLILFGADIYKKTISSMDSNYASRTSVAYITEKIRQSDQYDSIYIDDSLGYERLMMTQEINGLTYATTLYEYDGYLYELFARTDIELPIDAGQQVIAINNLKFELVTDSLLKVDYTDESGEAKTIYITLHCKAATTSMQAPSENINID
jgi:hypothetical protein